MTPQTSESAPRTRGAIRSVVAIVKMPAMAIRVAGVAFLWAGCRRSVAPHQAHDPVTLRPVELHLGPRRGFAPVASLAPGDCDRQIRLAAIAASAIESDHHIAELSLQAGEQVGSIRIDDDDEVLAHGAVRRHNACQTDGSESALISMLPATDHHAVIGNLARPQNGPPWLTS